MGRSFVFSLFALWLSTWLGFICANRKLASNSENTRISSKNVLSNKIRGVVWCIHAYDFSWFAFELVVLVVFFFLWKGRCSVILVEWSWKGWTCWFFICIDYSFERICVFCEFYSKRCCFEKLLLSFFP